ncbi:MAG: RidA family protein [Chlorobi bacterium]|nr:RidA family protein [Chlorobiota bacterium]
MTRKNITYNHPLEKEIGFSRAVRIGNIIAITATAPIAKDGYVHTPGDMYGQTKRCLEIIKDVTEQAGGKPDDVIRTRLFLKDIKRWKEAAKAHGEFFSGVQPASSFIGVSGFIDPEWLIEVEADCVLQE